MLRALDVRVLPGTTLQADMFGPPAPPMLAAGAGRAIQRARPAPSPMPARADGPFAALAALRR